MNTVLDPTTHSSIKSGVLEPHTNSTFITSFVNRYASTGFNYQTLHVTGNNGITHIHSSGHNLPYTASRSERASVCLDEQNSGVISSWMKLPLVSANKTLRTKSRPWPLSHEFRLRIKAICWLVTCDYLKPVKTIPATYFPTISQNNCVRCKSCLSILEASNTTGHCTAHPLICHFFTAGQKADNVIGPQQWNQPLLHLSPKWHKRSNGNWYYCGGSACSCTVAGVLKNGTVNTQLCWWTLGSSNNTHVLQRCAVTTDTLAQDFATLIWRRKTNFNSKSFINLLAPELFF